jgi:hypothetical protein
LPELAELSTEHRKALLGCVKGKTAAWKRDHPGKDLPQGLVQGFYSSCSQTLGLEKRWLPLLKEVIEDKVQRIAALISSWETEIQFRFYKMIYDMQQSLDLDEIARLIESGNVMQAVRTVELHTAKFANGVNASYLDSGESAENFLVSREIAVVFDQTNSRAVRWMQENRLRLVREMVDDTRAVLRQTMTRGIETGINPREQARYFRSSIGLTARQEAAVSNYRRLLGQNSTESLTRALRDRRFDPTVQRAIGTGNPLTPEQIDRMVARYRERYIKYRAETIARTETLRSVHQGNREMYQQAIDSGTLTRDGVIQIWNVRLDGRQRDWHGSMTGQERQIGEMFISGQGNSLEYPGDFNAPGSETIDCRCRLSTRIVR